MRLILIRHTSLSIPSGICYGQSDVDVSATFLNEAEKIRHNLMPYPVDSAYTSPLTRCTKLADFCGFSNAIPDERLLELNFGDWEMQAWDHIEDPNLQRWYDNWIDTPTTGGESFKNQYLRYVSFIDELSKQSPHQTIALFTHAGILHCARIHAGLDTFDTAFATKLNYGEILELNL